MQAQPFPDNWSYLKVELNWLEKLLLVAVARQRREVREVERVAQTKADRATSHWWKGMVSLDGTPSFDSPQEKRKGGDPSTYEQQLEARIQASLEAGVALALPQLCDRLGLSAFEKKLLLMSLAPEVHRRYGQLYGYLQFGSNDPALPNVDLALRLFCRNDAEWREGRSRLSPDSPLLLHGLLEFLAPEEPLLHRSFKLSDLWVSHLLEETTSEPPPQPAKPAKSLDQLVLPSPLREQLTHLSHHIQFAAQVDEQWGFQSAEPGIIAFLTGAAGTGKTAAVQAIAQLLNTSLVQIDLALLTPTQQQQFLKAIEQRQPLVMLVKSAERWQTGAIETAKFLHHRRSQRSLTFLSSRQQPAIQQTLRSQIQLTLQFPKPNKAMRQQLWQQAIPSQVPLAPIDWAQLATKPLTGGEIAAIARSAAFIAAAQDRPLNQDHLEQALRQATHAT
jgi:hypothetical protein